MKKNYENSHDMTQCGKTMVTHPDNSSIAFFGGSFNPPHLGHRAVVEWLSQVKRFDEIWMVPSYCHPFGKELVPFEYRLEMCRLQFGDIANVVVSDIERATHLSYTYDLLSHLKTTHPSHEFTLILGSDTLRELPRWKNVEALRRDFKILPIPRQGWDHSPFPYLQSRIIRDDLAHGTDQTSTVGAKVMDYIRREHLYTSV